MKMSDLAKIAGVSKSTVSRALAGSELVSQETRDKVKALAEEHGYRMDMRARNFRLKSTLTIGVLLPSNGTSDWAATNPFTLEMLGVISDQLELRGHELLLAKHSGNDPSWVEEFAQTRSVDGIIVLGQSLYHDVLNQLASWYKNIVIWGAELPDQKYFTVGSDNFAGGCLAAKELLSKNRKHFAFVGNINCPETNLRFKGFKETLSKANKDFIPTIITCSDNQHENTEQMIQDTFKKGAFNGGSVPYDAIFTASDMMAISAIKAIQSCQLKVPDDVSVVGYDNIALAKYMTPSITSINQDRAIAGEALVEKLFDIIDGNPTNNTKLSTEILCRESS